MSQTASFTPIEEAVYNLERKSIPWNVQFEVETTETIDVESLREAARAACAVHPLARARRRPHRGWDDRYVWEIPDGVDDVPVRVVEGDGDLAAVRAAFYGEPFDLTAAEPPFRLLVARGAGEGGGDRLLLCHSHVAADGVGGMRLLRTICAAYRGVGPTADPVDLEESRAALDDVRPSSFGARVNRLGEAASHLQNTVRPPSRITPEGGVADDHGWGFVHRRVDDGVATAMVEDRPPGVSVNDVLLAALHLTIDRWNSERGDDPGKVSLMMPVNLRPEAWRYDVVGMYALFESVTTEPEHRRDPMATLERVAEQTAELKRPDRAAAFLESLELIPTGTPVGLKQQLPELLRGPGRGLLDTAMLSNLGRIPEPLPALADEAPSSVWFSPPAWRPTPVGVGVATVAGSINLGFRYLRSTFDADAAASFADLYLECLGEAT